jgi:hypothetical protein
VLLFEQVVVAATASVRMTMRCMPSPYIASTNLKTQRFTIEPRRAPPLPFCG